MALGPGDGPGVMRPRRRTRMQQAPRSQFCGAAGWPSQAAVESSDRDQVPSEAAAGGGGRAAVCASAPRAGGTSSWPSGLPVKLPRELISSASWATLTVFK
eukprot:238368-Hanusia_phi.AAC.1